MNHLRQFVASTLAILSASVAAQQGSFTDVGQPCSPRALSSTDVPRIGATFTVTVPNTTFASFPRTYSYLAVGASDRAWAGVPLPVALEPISVLYCGTLRTSIDVLIFVGDRNLGPFVDVPFAIPNDPSLLGASFFMQQMSMTPGHLSPGFHLALSQMGHGIIGR